MVGIKSDDTFRTLVSVGVVEEDYKDIENHGMSLEFFAQKIKTIQEGVLTVPISRPLKKEDIISLNELPVDKFSEELVVSKFTPSSGAASRMFQSLVETLKSITEQNVIPSKHEKSIEVFMSGLMVESQHNFAFLEELDSILLEKLNISLSDLIAKIKENDVSKIESLKVILEHVLEEKGLNYSNKPKALISFHKNSDGRPITALEEQMVDAVIYGQSRLHLTVSEEHLAWYEKVVEEIKIENEILKDVDVSYSFQAKGTDSPGLGEDGMVFRDNEGKIKFFPAGHGSLVDNLKNTPVCIIRNIDNVPNPQKSRDEISESHLKMLDALSFFTKSLNQVLNDFLNESISGVEVEKKLLELINKYKLNLFINLTEFSKANGEVKKDMLIKAINRPFRILGVVKNEGEPGGGPFFVQVNGNSTVSIVEKDELRTPEQVAMMKEGDFFNPVDIAYSSLDIYGQPFEDLTLFVDKGRSFVVEKTDKQTGRLVRRMEHPGLWNGAMGKVNTVTVELPINTFGPVKEVNDLITKLQHQN